MPPYPKLNLDLIVLKPFIKEVCSAFSFEKLWQQKMATGGKIIVRTTTPNGFSNDFFAAPRFHPFLWDVIMYLPTSNRWFIFPYANIVFSTGNTMLLSLYI